MYIVHSFLSTINGVQSVKNSNVPHIYFVSKCLLYNKISHRVQCTSCTVQYTEHKLSCFFLIACTVYTVHRLKFTNNNGA